MKLTTEKINIYKNDTIFRFKTKITYFWFKNKLFLVEGGYADFKRSFRFWDLIGRDDEIIPLFKEGKKGELMLERTEIMKEYNDFWGVFNKRKPTKPMSYEKRVEVNKKIRISKQKGYAEKKIQRSELKIKCPNCKRRNFTEEDKDFLENTGRCRVCDIKIHVADRKEEQQRRRDTKPLNSKGIITRGGM